MDKVKHKEVMKMPEDIYTDGKYLKIIKNTSWIKKISHQDEQQSRQITEHKEGSKTRTSQY